MIHSLRGRLLAGLLPLVVAGLVVSDLVTYTALQSFLAQRVDQQLKGSAQSSAFFARGESFTAGPGGRGGPGGGQPPSGLPTGTYVELRGPDGSVLGARTLSLDESTASARPALPASLPTTPIDVPRLSTVAGTGGVAEYRLLLQTLDAPGVSGDTVALAIPLTDVDSTLHQLLLLELLISAAVLLAMGLFALLIIRAGLQPLERMGATAQKIAAGDLSKRVEPASAKTEIGRLGVALNSMLSQIEAAFAERTESERRLRRFMADASHELRTPLTSIRGYAELLRRDQPAEDAALGRRRIEEESIRMTSLVDDMLLLARLDQGRPLEREPVDLAAVARDVCADARAVAPTRAITLSEQPLLVSGDEPRLRQVVGNLVRNALVHTPSGSPLEVALERKNGVGVLSVADHGPGLEPEARRRVFEPFYRADPGRSRDRGGSGLGLSIVAAVVAAHGGRIEVRDTPGGGATFRVELPLAGAGQAPKVTAGAGR